MGLDTPPHSGYHSPMLRTLKLILQRGFILPLLPIAIIPFPSWQDAREGWRAWKELWDDCPMDW